jgi:HEAT repeat protein
LLAGARSADFDIRAAAIGSLGWWEPLRRNAVKMYLQDARFDNDADVRHAARAALARLGERQALQWFRQGLASDNRQVVMESIQAIADEGITLLWPELDQFADEEEPELASCAREALEQMQEELEREPKL